MGRLLYYGMKQLQSLASSSSNRKLIKNLQNQVRTQGAKYGLSSVSSIQLGSNIEMFIMLKKGFLKEGQWRNYTKIKQANYDCFCNPQVKDSAEQCESDWEECGSYPGLRMLIRRPISIIWKYMDEFLKDYDYEEVTGFKARVIQHEISHLRGEDLLSTAEDIQITDPSVQDKQQQIKKLHNEYIRALTLGENNEKSSKALLQFRKLKQKVVYSLIDRA